MFYLSTRGDEKVTGAEAIVKGLADNGGLYVPESFPQLSYEDIEAMSTMSYSERVAKILALFLDDYDEKGLQEACEKAYSKFVGDPTPLVRIDDGVYILELFNGPTCSYKDTSVLLMPYLLEEGLKKLGIKDKLFILTATTGDTGKSALESFKNMDGVKVMTLFPDDGVSKMQRLQLCAQEGDNVNVLAVKGSYDDCQAIVKDMFNNAEFKNELKQKGAILTTVNSINVGRILPQIAYYFSSYVDLLSGGQIEKGEVIDYSVPCGNFSNALAGYYAKLMGLPIRFMHCASNMNNALYEFMSTGVYNVGRGFYKTTSPSMDIMFSTNVERLVFEMSGRNGELTLSRMENLQVTGKYALASDEKAELTKSFVGGWANEDEVVEVVYDIFCEVGYTMDTHTGCAMKIAQDWYEKNKKDETKIVVVATTNPYKFPQDVLYCVTGNDVKDSFKGVKRLHAATAMTAPKALTALRDKPIRFNKTVAINKVAEEIFAFVE